MWLRVRKELPTKRVNDNPLRVKLRERVRKVPRQVPLPNPHLRKGQPNPKEERPRLNRNSKRETKLVVAALREATNPLPLLLKLVKAEANLPKGRTTKAKLRWVVLCASFFVLCLTQSFT